MSEKPLDSAGRAKLEAELMAQYGVAPPLEKTIAAAHAEIAARETRARSQRLATFHNASYDTLDALVNAAKNL